MLILLYILLYFIIFLMGAILGSFMHVITIKARKNSDFFEIKQCPNCGHKLGTWDNVPVFSWLLSRGKCRYCKGKVPKRSFLIELVSGAAAMLLFVRLDVLAAVNTDYVLYISAVYVLYLAVFLILLDIVIVDFETMKIPDRFNIALLMAGLLSVGTAVINPDTVLYGFSLWDTIWPKLLGFIIISIPFLIIALLKKDSIGGGDIKLTAAAGFLLGYRAMLVAVFIGCILSLIHALLIIVFKKKGLNDYLAFGPSLCVGIFLALLFANQIIDFFYKLL